MSELDLDAKRAARAEKLGAAPVLKVGGEAFALPHRLPLVVLEEIAHGKFVSGFTLLLGGNDEARRLLVMHGFDQDDLKDLFTELYGVALGEATASIRS